MAMSRRARVEPEKLEDYDCAFCKDKRVYQTPPMPDVFLLDPCPYCSDRGWADG